MKRSIVVLASLCLFVLAVSAGPAFAGGVSSPCHRVLQVQSASNDTSQQNSAGAINVPIASGNNVAIINTGDQSASAGTTQEQVNLNKTTQLVGQVADPGSGSAAQFQEAGNDTYQSNDAEAVNIPILSGNNVALINTGSQSSSAGVTQVQSNGNSTFQGLLQAAG
jgi:hypothetical protein